MLLLRSPAKIAAAEILPVKIQLLLPASTGGSDRGHGAWHCTVPGTADRGHGRGVWHCAAQLLLLTALTSTSDIEASNQCSVQTCFSL
jgi:hypothetical protein